MKRASMLIELLVVVCLIFILLGTFAICANIVLMAAREEALQSELNNIRMAIEHYRIATGKLPQGLNDLLNKELTFTPAYDKITQRRFLDSFRVDKSGFLVDPFFNKYSYEEKSGRVWSQTPGHKNW